MKTINSLTPIIFVVLAIALVAFSAMFVIKNHYKQKEYPSFVGQDTVIVVDMSAFDTRCPDHELYYRPQDKGFVFSDTIKQTFSTHIPRTILHANYYKGIDTVCDCNVYVLTHYLTLDNDTFIETYYYEIYRFNKGRIIFH